MRIGERMMSDTVSVLDDCKDPALFPFPFDAEGVSTKVVTMIDRGTCAAFVYDTPTGIGFLQVRSVKRERGCLHRVSLFCGGGSVGVVHRDY